MTTFREDHDRQMASVNARARMDRASQGLKNMIKERFLKHDELPGKTVLKTYKVDDQFVLVVDTGHYFALEIDDGYYDESSSLLQSPVGIETALRLGIITDDEFEEYRLLQHKWYLLSKDASESEKIHRLIKDVGADKVRKALGE